MAEAAAQASGARGSGTPRPLVIAYDGSDPARRAISRAAELFPGRAATVVTAWTGVREQHPELLLVPGGAVFAAAGALSELMSERAGELSAEGAALASASGLTAQARAVHADRALWDGIVSCAEELDAEAIVLGSRGHSTLVAAVLGSVSTGVLHHSTRPVVVVR